MTRARITSLIVAVPLILASVSLHCPSASHRAASHSERDAIYRASELC